MSLLSELNTIAGSYGIPVETGVFTDPAPDTYLVLTPLSDTFDLHADDRPGMTRRRCGCPCSAARII